LPPCAAAHRSVAPPADQRVVLVAALEQVAAGAAM